jgi:predicted flavoprotein YhiN
VKNWPTDPLRQHDRLIRALCDDLLAGHRGLDGPNVTRVSEISRQINSQEGPATAQQAAGGDK